MRSLSRAAIRHPVRTLAAALLMVLAAAPGLLRLELRTDGYALAPARDPAVAYDRRIREELGVRDPIAVVVRTSHPDGVFNPGTLRRVRDLTAACERLDGVDAAGVMSLATEHTFRFQSRSFKLRTFLEPLPRSPEELATLRDDLRRIRIYDGVLVAADGRSTAVLVGAPVEGDRTPFYRSVREIARSFEGGGDTIEVVGAPVAESLLGSHILADLGVPPSLLGQAESLDGRRVGLMPLVLAVMALVFLAVFRHPLAALSPLLMIGTCLVVTFGLMGWLGVPVYLTTVVLPVILSAVGVADQIHIFLRYGELRRERPDLAPAALAAATMDEMAWPVIQISVTTLIGFLSFAVSPLAPVRAFGLFAAVGSLASLMWSLALVPALLTLLHPALGGRRAAREPSLLRRRIFGGLARLVSRRRWAVLAGALLLVLCAGDGLRRLEVQDSWVDGFGPDSRLARELRRFDRDFLGTHALLVEVQAEPLAFAGEIDGGAVDHDKLVLPAGQLPAGIDPGRLAGSWVKVAQRPAANRLSPQDWSGSVEGARREGDRLVLSLPLGGGSPKFWLGTQPGETLGYEVDLQPFMVPGTLQRIAGLETFLAGRPGVGGVRGPAGYLATTAFMRAPDSPDSRRLPDRADRTRALWSSYGFVRGPERLRQLVDPDYTRTLVTVFLKDSSYATARRLMADLRDYERRHLAPHGLRLGFAGDVAVSQALIDAVVTTQVRSLALSLVGILVVTALLGRSLRRGLLCVVPPTFAILLSFAAMGWLDIPLGVATSMFAAMTLGVGVDYSIHLLERHRRAREAGLTGEEAMADALTATGPAVAVDTLSVGLGFAVLLLSHVPANARLGGIVALSLVICLAATLLVVPALVGRRNAL